MASSKASSNGKSTDTKKKTCKLCGRVGSQRYTRLSSRGRPSFECTEVVACMKRQRDAAEKKGVSSKGASSKRRSAPPSRTKRTKRAKSTRAKSGRARARA